MTVASQPSLINIKDNFYFSLRDCVINEGIGCPLLNCITVAHSLSISANWIEKNRRFKNDFFEI